MPASGILILIPARMSASRLPGKPLADIGGRPMIAHVLERALAAEVGPVVVATDSTEIVAAVEHAGGHAVMTRASHASGSDRIFEALLTADPQAAAGIIVNVQGDLPMLDPADIRAALVPLDDPAVDIATLGARLLGEHEMDNPNVVKVSGQRLGPLRMRAEVFSRRRMSRPNDQERPVYHHIGLYAYRRTALARFVNLAQTKNEQAAKLEQLRALDNGMRIDVAIVESAPFGVDTPADLERARAMIAGRR